jgi:hypothetical protein
MNNMFSDKFAEEFANIGNSASRHSLDVGKAAYKSDFWTKLEAAFLVSKPYNLLQFTENDTFIYKMTAINPAKIVQHEWKKLRSIWKA